MRSLLKYTVFVLLCQFFANETCGETGMALVVDGSAFGVEGKIRRIDLENGTVINTTGSLGTGRWPRFSPDGRGFGYVRRDSTVVLCDLEGTIQKTFQAARYGCFSYTNSGIYIGAQGKIIGYDLNGNKTFDKTFSFCGSGYVCQAGNIAYGVAKDGNWTVFKYTLANGTTTKISTDEQGCSACPSPDGTMTTQNQGGPKSECHLFMRIRDKDAHIIHSLSLADVTGLSTDQPWCWNTQCWSGNSMDVIILPVGKDNGATNCRQLKINCQPWIYNIKEDKAYRLANCDDGTFWQPYDYYQGYLPVSVSPTLRPIPTGLGYKLTLRPIPFLTNIEILLNTPETMFITSPHHTLRAEIFNIRGELVHSFIAQPESAHAALFIWDTKTQLTGSYLVSIKSGNNIVIVQKTFLLK